MMWPYTKLILLFVMVLNAGGLADANAESKVSQLGGFGNCREVGRRLICNWNAETYVESKNKKTCHIWSRPIKKKGKYRKRGDVALYVTHRPWLKVKNQISVLAGYTYKKDSEPRALIGGTKFLFFTEKDVAWLQTAEQDRALVNAMRRGRTMTLDGLSSRSTRTTDIYSLTGFSAAHNAISKACRIK